MCCRVMQFVAACCRVLHITLQHTVESPVRSLSHIRCLSHIGCLFHKCSLEMSLTWHSAVCCRVTQGVAECCTSLYNTLQRHYICLSHLECLFHMCSLICHSAVCCRVTCNTLPHTATPFRRLLRIRSLLHTQTTHATDAVCSSVLQRDTGCCRA